MWDMMRFPFYGEGQVAASWPLLALRKIHNDYGASLDFGGNIYISFKHAAFTHLLSDLKSCLF